jgi:hypothetical protein
LKPSASRQRLPGTASVKPAPETVGWKLTSLSLLKVFAAPNPWTIHSECPVLARAIHFADREPA